MQAGHYLNLVVFFFFLSIYPKGPYGRYKGVGVKKEKEKAYGGNTFKEINELLEMS